MEMVEELAQAMIILIRSGVALRVIYCFMAMAGDEEQVATNKKRIKHVVVFYIMAESIYLIRDLVMSYYM